MSAAASLGRPGTVLRLLCAAVAVGLLAACADMGLWPDDGQPCFSHAECLPDQQCILGACTAVPDFEVDVEIEPTSVSGYLPLPVRAVDLASPGALEIVVPQPITVRGEVQLAGADYAGSARISFSPEVGLRRSLRRTVDVMPEEDSAAAFEVRLVGSMLDRGAESAIPYAVGVRPLEVAHCCDEGAESLCPAPRVISGVRFETHQEDIVLAFPDRPTRILGRILVEDAVALPLEGLQVQAFGESPHYHSLPAVSDADGRFCLALALPDEGDFAAVTLQAGPPPGSEMRAPNLEFHAVITPGGTHREMDLLVPAFGAPSAVAGRLVDQRGQPVPDVSVTFNGEVVTGGSYAATAVTDAYGHFVTELLPGTYHVRALPPKESRAGLWERWDFVVDTLSAGDAPYVLEQTLPERAILSGLVHGPGDETRDRSPLPDLDVIAERVTTATDSSGRHRRIETVTDDDGAFDLVLDPGEYRLLFRPARTTELPWMVGPTVTVDPHSHRDIGTVVLERAAVFEGKALGKAGGGQTVPLAGARVELHARRHDATFLLWEGRAEEDGTFRALLPTSLIGKVEATGAREDPDDDLR